MRNPTRDETYPRQIEDPHAATEITRHDIPEESLISDRRSERVSDETMRSVAGRYLMAWTGPFIQHNVYIPFIEQQSHELRVITSDHDAAPQDIATRLVIGMAVYDVQGKRLGDIAECDTAHRLVKVVYGFLRSRALLVRFGAIKSIDSDRLSVSLACSKKVVLKERTTPASADA